jgi:hypothetical protein
MSCFISAKTGGGPFFLTRLMHKKNFCNVDRQSLSCPRNLLTFMGSESSLPRSQEPLDRVLATWIQSMWSQHIDVFTPYVYAKRDPITSQLACLVSQEAFPLFTFSGYDFCMNLSSSPLVLHFPPIWTSFIPSCCWYQISWNRLFIVISLHLRSGGPRLESWAGHRPLWLVLRCSSSLSVLTNAGIVLRFGRDRLVPNTFQLILLYPNSESACGKRTANPAMGHDPESVPSTFVPISLRPVLMVSCSLHYLGSGCFPTVFTHKIRCCLSYLCPVP